MSRETNAATAPAQTLAPAKGGYHAVTDGEDWESLAILSAERFARQVHVDTLLLRRDGGAFAQMLQAAVDPELGQLFLDAVL